MRVLMVTQVRAAPRQRRGQAARPGRWPVAWPVAPISCCAPTTTATADVAGLQASGHRRAERAVAAHSGARRRRRGADPQCLGGPLLQPPSSPTRCAAPPPRPRSTFCRWSTCRWRRWRPGRRGAPARARPAQRRVGAGAQLRPYRARGRRARSPTPRRLALARHGARLMPSLRHRGGGERARAPRACPPGSRDVLVCPNGRDPDPDGPLAPSPTPTAAFVATLGWAPNVDAAVWFGKEVWPEVHRRAARRPAAARGA